MKIIRYLIFSLAASITVACGGETKSPPEIANLLEDARMALGMGDFERALEICNRLTDSADSTAMSWFDYCEAAVVYAAAYDHDVDTQTSMAAATKCIDRARALQPDSVESYITTLAPEYSGPLHTVIQTLDGLNTDHSTLGDHEESDFIDNDEEEHEEHQHDSQR